MAVGGGLAVISYSTTGSDVMMYLLDPQRSSYYFVRISQFNLWTVPVVRTLGRRSIITRIPHQWSDDNNLIRTSAKYN
jgi:hypothetical protein